MSVRTVKQVVEEYLNNNAMSDMKRASFAYGFRSHGSTAAAVVFEVKFTYQLDEIMNNRLDTLVLFHEIQSDVKDLLQAQEKSDNKL